MPTRFLSLTPSVNLIATMKKIDVEHLPDLNRRAFLQGGSLATLMAMLVPFKSKAQPAPEEEEAWDGLEVNCAVIGAGTWGREIISTLSRVKGARVAAVCDTYSPFLRRASRMVPEAETAEDYRTLLEDESIRAVIIATPTHHHRDIAVKALEAGKHVYCEAPLAHTLEDARAIAKAAKAVDPAQVFQAGLQCRSDPLRHDLVQFVRSGALGRPTKARAQWHKKHSWRVPAPNTEREREMNWRLDNNVSLGLIGEVGIHQVDAASWFLRGRPLSVSGYGSVLYWTQDGRKVPDTVHAVLEFPRGLLMTYDCTLTNSFDSDYDMFYGSESAIMVRDGKAWMFKEVDAPLLGWEVYARKDEFHGEIGISLMANATQLEAQGEHFESPYPETLLYYALEAFISNGRDVEDFRETFGSVDREVIADYLEDIDRMAAAGYLEGFESAVVAIKTNEAILKNTRIEFKDQWFEI
jgi:predicted dehydrogenase